jgi:hypothetical protein
MLLIHNTASLSGLAHCSCELHRAPDKGFSCGTIELAFRSYPFMQFSGAFDPILEVAPLGRQKARYHIDAVRHTRTNVRCVVHGLSDLEFMTAHSVLDST